MSRPVTVNEFSPLEDPGLDNDPTLHLTRLFVYFLQNYFRDFPEGTAMKWNPNEEVTELVITDEKPTVEEIEKRPHITCVLGSAQWSGLGLDQLQNQRALDGQRTHTDLIPSSMAYHCQTKEGVVARRIAWNASYGTQILRRIIMRVGGLHEVGVRHSISAETGLTAFTGPVAESDLVSVVVNVPFYWQPQWRIRRRADVWRRMRMSMHVRSGVPIYSAGRLNKLRPPMVGGVPVESVPLEPKEPAFTQEVYDDSYEEEE